MEGETVILDKESGFIHKLNDTASEIWNLVDGNKTIDDITQQICNKYNVDNELARCDIEEILQQLQQQKLIQEH